MRNMCIACVFFLSLVLLAMSIALLNINKNDSKTDASQLKTRQKDIHLKRKSKNVLIATN